MHTAPLPQPAARPATVLEDTSAVRDLIRAASGLPPAAQPVTGADETVRFRPRHRPPLLLLQALDDGEATGEVVRVRQTPFVIGRLEGDFRFGFDNQISTRHAELFCVLQGGYYVWKLRDLGSTNGVFVRAARILLQPDQEILIAGRRLKVVFPNTLPSPPSRPTPNITSSWQLGPVAMPTAAAPRLIDVAAESPTFEIVLEGSEFWLGRDPASCRVILDDPLVSPRHARFFLDERRRWCVENCGSLNGVWARISEIDLGKGGEFQCGEQQFAVKIL